jgi:hypothetical protein
MSRERDNLVSDTTLGDAQSRRMPSGITLSTAEIFKITQYIQPNLQLEELRAQGFWRARLGQMGEVVLERAHYEAVCAGAVQPTRALLEPEALPPRAMPPRALLQGPCHHDERDPRQHER